MIRADRHLAAMKRSPQDRWAIEEVLETVKAYGVRGVVPAGGAHYVLSHHLIDGLLTIPARRPLKPIHIMLVVDLLEAVSEAKKCYVDTKSSFSF